MMATLDRSEQEAIRRPDVGAITGPGSDDATGASLVGVSPVAGVAPRAVAQAGRWRFGDLGWAVLYMAPALLLFLAFTFAPFLRSIGLSFFVTDQAGNPARFNGLSYYARILNIDGSGRTE